MEDQNCAVMSTDPSSYCEPTAAPTYEPISSSYETTIPQEPSVFHQIPQPQEIPMFHQIPITEQPVMFLNQHATMLPQPPFRPSIPMTRHIPSRNPRSFPISRTEHQQMLAHAAQAPVVIPKFGALPTKMICPFCTTEITSKVKFEAGCKTHIMALILFLFCCIIFVWVPYCIDRCKVLKHYCPNCGGYLGAFNKHRLYGYNRQTGNIEVLEI